MPRTHMGAPEMMTMTSPGAHDAVAEQRGLDLVDHLVGALDLADHPRRHAPAEREAAQDHPGAA